MKENSTLFIKNISASYNKNQILENVEFQIHSGEFISLCGPNGSGKSTLLSCISKIDNSHLNTNGEIILQDDSATINLAELNPKDRAKKISCLLQSEFSTWDFTVEEFVLQGRFCHTKYANYTKADYSLVEKSLSLLEILNLRERTVHTLSGGEFQKVRIARALCQDAPYILLDEPANNLDFIFEPKLMETLKQICHEKNIGMLISIHDVNIAARFADKILFLPKNNIPIFGKTEEVFTKEIISKTYNTNCKVYSHPLFNCPQVQIL